MTSNGKQDTNVQLVVIGHLAINETTVKNLTRSSFGGSAYHVSWSASQFTSPNSVGLISICGSDFITSRLVKSGVNVDGLTVINRPSDKFIISENGQERSFSSVGNMSKGVTAESLPPSYRQARHVHLSTAPPSQQLIWLKHVRMLLPKATVSADSFELFVREDPKTVALLFNQVDLLFANEVEWTIISKYITKPYQAIVKAGAKGTHYIINDKTIFRASAIKNSPVETTGAGETVAGVYLALLLKEIGKQRSLETATKVASLSITDFGVEHITNNKTFTLLKNAI